MAGDGGVIAKHFVLEHVLARLDRAEKVAKVLEQIVVTGIAVDRGRFDGFMLEFGIMRGVPLGFGIRFP
jgi:hypothetical protein